MSTANWIYIYIFIYFKVWRWGRKCYPQLRPTWVKSGGEDVMAWLMRSVCGFFFCFPLYCPGELKCAYPFTSHSRAKYRTLSAIYCPQHATGWGGRGLLYLHPHPHPWLLRESFRIAGGPNSSSWYRFVWKCRAYQQLWIWLEVGIRLRSLF